MHRAYRARRPHRRPASRARRRPRAPPAAPLKREMRSSGVVPRLEGCASRFAGCHPGSYLCFGRLAEFATLHLPALHQELCQALSTSLCIWQHWVKLIATQFQWCMAALSPFCWPCIMNNRCFLPATGLQQQTARRPARSTCSLASYKTSRRATTRTSTRPTRTRTIAAWSPTCWVRTGCRVRARKTAEPTHLEPDFVPHCGGPR